MAGGTGTSSGGNRDFPGRTTKQVIACTVIASLGGFLFGYDLGITGGVTSMDEFLKKFFPKVYTRKNHAHENNYCKFDDQYLQLFTSSLYLAAILASFAVSFVAKKYGRKFFIGVASFLFLIGAALNAAALNLVMLILGRFFLGLGLGCSNQTVPLFISEIAPAKRRGALNIMFQLLITIGILVANLINYGSERLHYNWRLCLGLAGVPACLLLLGSFFIVDTPASLIERGKKEEGLNTLKKIRGVDNVDAEFEEIVRATEVSNRIKHPIKELFWNRHNRPPLICTIFIHFFQQFTGINVIMFYAPVLFQTMGFGGKAALFSAVITGLVNSVFTLVSNATVDTVLGRRRLLIAGGVLMFLGQCLVGGILKVNLKYTNAVSHSVAVAVVILICIFVSAYAWSWGPLGWLLASEFYPLETRNAGYFVAVGVNMACTFIIAQAFLTMLCHMRAFIFFFFAVFLALMTVSVFYMLPETKGIPMEEVAERAWKPHWFWSRFYSKAGEFEQMEATNEVNKTKEVELEERHGGN